MVVSHRLLKKIKKRHSSSTSSANHLAPVRPVHTPLLIDPGLVSVPALKCLMMRPLVPQVPSDLRIY